MDNLQSLEFDFLRKKRPGSDFYITENQSRIYIVVSLLGAADVRDVIVKAISDILSVPQEAITLTKDYILVEPLTTKITIQKTAMDEIFQMIKKVI